MNYLIIMPAYNEAPYIGLTLDSIFAQTKLPSKIVIVDDNSTDNTLQIANQYAKTHPILQVIHKESQSIHLPGSKVIQAFNYGIKKIDLSTYDVIVKLDADLILPKDYFQTVIQEFKNNPKSGIVGGFAYIQKNDQWILENLTDKDHVRGAFKAYRIQCYQQIQGLRQAMGWDTVDELLARYHNWQITTLPQLRVKHLKPTGANYNKASRYNQGRSFYTLGYGIGITLIASLKLAYKKNKPLLFFDYIQGYYQAKKQNIPWLVNHQQAKFIRKYRYNKIKTKLKKLLF
ncbi:glycosyltransferase family 2 protein [Myroides sp. LJL110]